MPMCPVCKTEYPEDFTHCPDCDIELTKQAPSTYKSPEDRYSEMNSSAWTLLIVGVLGFLFMLLCWMGIIRFPLHNFALTVMTVIFLILIAVGIISFLSAKKLKANISVENSFISEITTWYHTTGKHSPQFQSIDPKLPEELLYFQKSELIRNMICEKFPQIDPALLDKLTDDFCEEDFSS